MTRRDLDRRVRAAAFATLERLKRAHGDVLSLDHLRQGFPFEGETVLFLTRAKGIFKPRILCDYPLSIRTTPARPDRPRPYADTFVSGGLLYSYRGTDPAHPDNLLLKRARDDQVPLVYFHGTVPGRYWTIWPTYIAGADDSALRFEVVFDDAQAAGPDGLIVADADANIRRRYYTGLQRKRLHQRMFRDQVIRAYQQCCAFCRLRHDELLDAAHIVADRDEGGDPVVSNGLALCKLHHAAFDADLVGVKPDYRIVVRDDIRREIDGPMLIHGLQGFHGRKIRHPRSSRLRPDPRRLQLRFERFLAAR